MMLNYHTFSLRIDHKYNIHTLMYNQRYKRRVDEVTTQMQKHEGCHKKRKKGYIATRKDKAGYQNMKRKTCGRRPQMMPLKMIATLERHASKKDNAKQCKKGGYAAKKERRKFVRLKDRDTSVHSDAPVFPSMIKHPLNLTNGFVDHFSVELVGGVCTSVCWLLAVSESAAQVHLRPEEYACTSDVTGRQVEACNVFHSIRQEA